MTVGNLLVLGLCVCLSATCVAQEAEAEGSASQVPRTLEDIRAELQQKQSQEPSLPAGRGTAGENFPGMSGGSNYGGGGYGGMMGGKMGGMAGSSGGEASSSMGGMGSMGMMGSMGGMMGSSGDNMLGESAEKQLLAQIVGQIRARLNSNKFQREQVEQQLRAALQQYFNEDMAERVSKFDKVKARVVEMEAKLQLRLDREDEIIDLQLQQMLHHADGLDFQVPGLPPAYQFPGVGSFPGADSAEPNVSVNPNSIGYDSAFEQTRVHRLDPDALVDYDPLKSYATNDVSAEFVGPISDGEKKKAILLAFHQFHEHFHHFPSSSNRQFANQPAHSWRVAILPLINQTELFNEYHFDQPWNSPQNLELAKQMPPLFRSNPNNETSTSFVMLTGGGAFGSDGSPTRFPDITDGTSNTIAVIQSSPEVPWTQPVDFVYSAFGELPNLSPSRLVGLADGQATQLPKLEDKEFRALITRGAGEPVKDGWWKEQRY